MDNKESVDPEKKTTSKPLEADAVTKEESTAL